MPNPYYLIPSHLRLGLDDAPPPKAADASGPADDPVAKAHLLGGLLGEDALKAFPDAAAAPVRMGLGAGNWDATLHPRGKDGRF